MARFDVATQCEALFTSDLQSSQCPAPRQVRAAIRDMLRALGVRHCAEQVAQEFGDHPDTAVARMRWVRGAVSLAYSDATRDSRRHGAARLTACRS
jgi:hypothetical protein